MQIILASNNQKKINELKEILSWAKVWSYRDFLDEMDILEEGQSFEENAMLKARAIYSQITLDEDFLILADDSGLCVEALKGMPGIYSARFASIVENAQEMTESVDPTMAYPQDDRANNLKLLQCLEDLGILQSPACFVCVIAICGRIGNQELCQTFRGECRGKVIQAPLNPDAFGYDPLFVPRGYQQTMDQIEEKNSISHRFDALQKLKNFLKDFQ